MPHWPLKLCRGEATDAATVIELIEGAAAWLRTRGTDQWERPWPTKADRDGRIVAALEQRKTWIGWDGSYAAATITTDPDSDRYWSHEQRGEPAVYIHRLVVSRPYSGVELGAELLDWAGAVARRTHGAQWIRVSAWTTNLLLHSYYQRIGFEPCGRHPDDGYPSAARFQKRIASIRPRRSGLFLVDSPCSG